MCTIGLNYKEKIQILQRTLLVWFKCNGRNFPWRNKSANLYDLIIAEVLLQRTKADTVAKFLPSFLLKYPSWETISKSTVKELEIILKPIGLYKQRSYRLHAMSHEIIKRKGQFPDNREELEKLPMMGQYIANAYELYALNSKSPLLDVNMARLLERVFGSRKLADIRYDPHLQKLAKQVVNHDDPKGINWAILDYATLVCRKKNPKCNTCIIKSICSFYSKTSSSSIDSSSD